MAFRTEDQVRNEAGITLGFIDSHGNNVETSNFISGVGQLTTFIQLGDRIGTTDFNGISDILMPRFLYRNLLESK